MGKRGGGENCCSSLKPTLVHMQKQETQLKIISHHGDGRMVSRWHLRCTAYHCIKEQACSNHIQMNHGSTNLCLGKFGFYGLLGTFLDLSLWFLGSPWATP